jgi:hypothetical protein
MKTTLTFLAILACYIYSFSQSYYQQYFDGADTSAWNSIFVHIEADSNNLWQVGTPQKTIFNAPATIPNVIVTDTINSPSGANLSRFEFKIGTQVWGWGILALQWMQKLDMPPGLAGGIIEFSVDTGQTWQNAFNNPYVYNFYGYQPGNHDTLFTGEEGFSGQDTSWRDIWLCYDLSWMFGIDTIGVRFTFKADSVAEGYEGWMIDNLLAHITFGHTLKEVPKDDHLLVYPSVTSNRIHILAAKHALEDYIERIEVMDPMGRIVESIGPCPTRFWMDLQHLTPGNYYVRVTTPHGTETSKVVLMR